MARLHDVLILGATPAGYAAATYLAEHKYDVLVIDAPPIDPAGVPVECPLADWVPATLFTPGKGKVPAGISKNLVKDAGAETFHAVHYHDVNLQRSARYALKEPAGYFVSPDALGKAMRNEAVVAGATVRSTRNPVKIRPQEDHVDVVTSRPIHGRLLIVAHDTPEAILAQLGRPMREASRPMTAVGLDVPIAPNDRKRADAWHRPLRDALHVVELPERSELGLFFVAGDVLHLRVLSTSAAAGNRSAELTGMIQALQKAKALPPDLDLAHARGAVWRPSSAAALEQETHEAKRCLLAGSAGGFSESVTGQAIYPAIRSGLLAAATIQKALSSKNPQETLMTFKDTWRKALADYLRPPNTSLAMLLPLLFVNEGVVEKFSRALLYGEDI
jgi:flavin-dependent dehydrogenase